MKPCIKCFVAQHPITVPNPLKQLWWWYNEHLVHLDAWPTNPKGEGWPTKPNNKSDFETNRHLGFTKSENTFVLLFSYNWHILHHSIDCQTRYRIHIKAGCKFAKNQMFLGKKKWLYLSMKPIQGLLNALCRTHLVEENHPTQLFFILEFYFQNH